MGPCTVEGVVRINMKSDPDPAKVQPPPSDVRCPGAPTIDDVGAFEFAGPTGSRGGDGLGVELKPG